MTSNPNQTWDPFFGPDPLAGRVNDLCVSPYKKSVFSGPISNQNFVSAWQETRALVIKMHNESSSDGEEHLMRQMPDVLPVSLRKKRSLDATGESFSEPRTTFAAVVASNSTGKLQQYCSFCKANREGL